MTAAKEALAVPAAEAALAANLAIHPETHPQVINARAAHGTALALVDRPRAASAEPPRSPRVE